MADSSWAFAGLSKCKGRSMQEVVLWARTAGSCHLQQPTSRSQQSTAKCNGRQKRENFIMKKSWAHKKLSIFFYVCMYVLACLRLPFPSPSLSFPAFPFHFILYIIFIIIFLCAIYVPKRHLHTCLLSFFFILSIFLLSHPACFSRVQKNARNRPDYVRTI